MVKASDLEEFGSRRWQILAAYDYMVKMMELDMDQKEVEEKRSFPEQIGTPAPICWRTMRNRFTTF